MLENRFRINKYDKCVYVKNTKNDYVILCLYVDDTLILVVIIRWSNLQKICWIQDLIWKLKDMVPANVILGIKITSTLDGLILSQSHYDDKILEKFNKDDSSIAKTPFNISQHLSKNKCENVSQVEYSRIIGGLMYLLNCTRPDIAYTVSKLSTYTSKPGTDHWKGIVRVLRYLRYIRTHGLHYTRYSTIIEGFSDVN